MADDLQARALAFLNKTLDFNLVPKQEFDRESLAVLLVGFAESCLKEENDEHA